MNMMMPGMGPMMMPGMPGMDMGMGGMNGMFIMMQMMQLMQMLMMMMGQRQQQGGCGCGQQYPQMGMGNQFGNMMMPQMPNYGGAQMPWSGGCGCQQAYPGNMYGTGPGNWNPQTGNRLADMAASWNGQHFKPGQTRRCADFVSTMLTQSGTAPPGFRHQVSAAGLRNYGTPIGGGTQNLRPGDVVFFGNTYRPGHTTHVGIYLGDGRFAHRPTANAPVKIDNINSRYWSSHYTGANRMG
jgi:hypothetical protein